MKLTTGINILSTRNIEKTLSKKILLANTNSKVNPKSIGRAIGESIDPMYQDDFTLNNQFNPDIRFRSIYGFTPLTNINYRNNLLLFSENNEIKKAVDIISNETVYMDTETQKYPVYPKINHTLIDKDKQDVSKAIQEYLDNVFYPKLYNFLKLKDSGLKELIEEFLKTGKLAFEIVYDNLKRPTDIIDMLPIDPSTLQKIKSGDYIYYIQKAVGGSAKERIMHENQIVLVEYNKYDYGYISYVDTLKMSYNIMRSMMTSKIMWFATKSQVRMHVKLALGDITRDEAIQKLVEAKNTYKNKFNFEDDGTITFNNKPGISSYREFYTAETSASGSPEMEELNSNGPDLTEVDSLQFWERGFWKTTEIPYDRIDPNSSETWGFTDVTSLRKIEINFSKLIGGNRKLINPIFIKPITIQLTLKEAEIGVDLGLIDSIKMEWNAFNQYDKLAELEVLQKKVDLATGISQFGELEDVEGNMRKSIPLNWIIKNYMDFTDEQLKSMVHERNVQDIELGFKEAPENVEELDEIIEDKEIIDDEFSNLEKTEEESAENIQDFENEAY